MIASVKNWLETKRIVLAVKLVESLGYKVCQINTRNGWPMEVIHWGYAKIGERFFFVEPGIVNSYDDQVRFQLAYYKSRCSLLEDNLAFYLNGEGME